MGWTGTAVDRWMTQGLPYLAAQPRDLFPTGSGLLVTEQQAHRRFTGYIEELGYPPGLDMHSFRRSYASHLQEYWGFDVKFVQEQLGHEHVSTTSIYTRVSSDFQTSELNRVLTETVDASKRSKPREATQ